MQTTIYLKYNINYIYIYIYIYTDIYKNKHTHTHTHTHIYIYMYALLYIYIYIYIYIWHVHNSYRLLLSLTNNLNPLPSAPLHSGLFKWLINSTPDPPSLKQMWHRETRNWLKNFITHRSSHIVCSSVRLISFCGISTLVGYLIPNSVFSYIKSYISKRIIESLFVCLFVWVLWHIKICRLFNAKSIFIQISSSISNNSV